jgi:hypothetical protein
MRAYYSMWLMYHRRFADSHLDPYLANDPELEHEVRCSSKYIEHKYVCVVHCGSYRACVDCCAPSRVIGLWGNDDPSSDSHSRVSVGSAVKHGVLFAVMGVITGAFPYATNQLQGVYLHCALLLHHHVLLLRVPVSVMLFRVI